MANAKQLALLKKSVGAWNQFRGKDPAVDVDLSQTNLSGVNLATADLYRADLSDANLSRANLGVTRLGGADLSGANLREASLVWADLNGANLDRAKIFEATVGSTIFGDVDLSVVKGLATVVHRSPSTIGIDTLLKSGGKIPDEFLRGCGVDPLIQRMLVGDGHSKSQAFTEWVSLGHNPLQRCFISYATEDKPFVDRLQKVLNQHKVDYWYAPEHGRWGEELQRQVNLEISLRDRMLLVCSKVSLTKDWVQYEIERGIEQEKKRGARVIFPIMMDDAFLTWNHPRATHIREVLAADFRKATKGHAFEEQLPRLLKALGYAS